MVEEKIPNFPLDFDWEKIQRRYRLSQREIDTLLNLRGSDELSRMSQYAVLESLGTIPPESRCRSVAAQLGLEIPPAEGMLQFFAAAMPLLRSGQKGGLWPSPEELLANDLAALQEKGGVSRETVEKLAQRDGLPEDDRFFRLLVTAAVLRNAMGGFERGE